MLRWRLRKRRERKSSRVVGVPFVASVSPLSTWNEPLAAPFVVLHTPPESVPVVDRCKFVPLYEKIGVAGLIDTLSVPTAVPEANPVVVLVRDKAIEEIVCAPVPVIVSGCVNGEPLAPLWVATMFKLEVPAATTPLVTRLDPEI